MLTLQDCVDLTDLSAEEVQAIADHEHLPYIVALEKGFTFLREPWGEPAVRQIVWDNMVAARAADRPEKAVCLTVLYRNACARHPGGIDRRTNNRA